MEANAKYLNDYSRIAEDVKLGMSTNEIVESYEGNVNKSTIQTVRKILEYQTPNSEMMGQWIFIVNDLEKGLSVNQIVEKYPEKINMNIVQTIRRILKNQLY